MAICVSLINMKGGVGKTTLASQLAWHATRQNNKRVLLIDLDPQANASQSIMTPAKYVEHLDADRPTIVNLFEEFTPSGLTRGSPTALDAKALIHRRVKYSEGGVLDVLPSRLELSWTLRNSSGKENLLARFVAKVQENYDLIVIDCAPTDSMLTDAAYLCSRYILVPIKAEFLAAIGFPLLKRSLEAFKIRHEDHLIEICGLVFNDYYRNRREYTLAREDIEHKAQAFGWHIFSNDIPHSDSYFRSAREGMPIDATKGAHTTVKDDFDAFATEFCDRIKL